MVNDAGDGLGGVRLDRYGDYAVLELTSTESHERRGELVRDVLGLGPRGVYVKCRIRADLRNRDAEAFAPATPDVGEPAPESMVVSEAGLRFEACLSDGWDTGLYVDQRDNRQRVRRQAKDKNVLNLFCYTGSFTVAAASGGARSTTSVDLSRRALSRAQARTRTRRPTISKRPAANSRIASGSRLVGLIGYCVPRQSNLRAEPWREATTTISSFSTRQASLRPARTESFALRLPGKL